ncbi:MAG TPA: DUF4395 domain-containing protein [Nakamurella sp.]
MAFSVPELFRFPNPVNEKVARSVGGLVVLLTVATLVIRSPWLLWAQAIGFVLRVAFGPRVSPFAVLASRVIAPRLGPAKLVPGPPKRFAQTIGAVLSVSALVAYYLGAPTASWVLVAMITVAAFLESVFAICLGCIIFGRLQAIGVIPASVCEACNDIRLRTRPLTANEGAGR